MGYKQTREKVASDFALYECVGMDMVPLGSTAGMRVLARRDHRKID